MTNPRATVVGFVEHGTPRLGLWCDACALPSRIEVEVHLITDHSVMPLGTWSKCLECGRES